MSQQEELGWKTLLESKPPGEYKKVSGALGTRDNSTTPSLIQPTLNMYCDSEECGGMRNFDSSVRSSYYSNHYIEDMSDSIFQAKSIFIHYRCRHCHSSSKDYAVRVILNAIERKKPKAAEMLVDVVKFGEWPSFGPYTPSRLISLVGPDRDLFLKGRRSESQGLGIGAFGYYRRVVENQKNRLLDEAIKVAERTGAPTKVVEALRSAQEEPQFSAAVEKVRETFPESLKIKGHSPLTLLHSALSEGLHADSDEECLEAASSIRLVLVELAERVNQILRNQTELDAAVARLMKKKNK